MLDQLNKDKRYTNGECSVDLIVKRISSPLSGQIPTVSIFHKFFGKPIVANYVFIYIVVVASIYRKVQLIPSRRHFLQELNHSIVSWVGYNSRNIRALKSPFNLMIIEYVRFLANRENLNMVNQRMTPLKSFSSFRQFYILSNIKNQ